MFPPSPNEKTAEKSLTARIVYFVVGGFIGAGCYLRYQTYHPTTEFLGLPLTPIQVFIAFVVLFGLLIAWGGTSKSLHDLFRD